MIRMGEVQTLVRSSTIDCKQKLRHIQSIKILISFINLYNNIGIIFDGFI